MQIHTWNVNGLRSLIREYGDINSVFNRLKPDILCIQESRIGLDDISIGFLPEGYDAFLSSCVYNKGYAGVMTYVRESLRPSIVYTNLKDLIRSSLIQDKDSIDSRYDEEFLKEANDEGRIVVLGYDNALIFNIYFPANSEDKREDFRQQFYDLIKDLLLQIDRSTFTLFVAGDFNTACGIVDSAYLENDHERNGYIEQFRSMSEWLEWFQLPLNEKGCGLVDTFRTLHPAERNQYTCFCNLFGGRSTNFGSRIDYIFCDDRIQEKIKHAEILTSIQGSDHVPVLTRFDFTLHCKTHVKGIHQLVHTQHRIHHFFTKHTIEKKPTLTNKRSSKEVQANEGEWACSRCTFLNKQTNTYCEMCGTKQTKSNGMFVEVGIGSFFGKKRKMCKVPLCSGHNLPCTRHQVSKEGKNKGRFFYISFLFFTPADPLFGKVVHYPLGLQRIQRHGVTFSCGKIQFSSVCTLKSFVFYDQ